MSAELGSWISIDLGLLPGEVCGDWDRDLSRVEDEATGERVGFIDENTGARLRIWIGDVAE